jgi:hypothetical protein
VKRRDPALLVGGAVMLVIGTVGAISLKSYDFWDNTWGFFAGAGAAQIAGYIERYRRNEQD